MPIPFRLTLPLSLLISLTRYTLPLQAAPPSPKPATPPPPAPTALRCDLLPTPDLTRIDDPHPRLSWVMNAADTDETQTAYQIQFANSTADLARGKSLLWDSGRIATDRSLAVAYAGSALASNSEYWWRVRTRDKHGAWSAWSAPQHVRTGDLTPTRPIADGVERLPLTQTTVVPVADRLLPNGNRLLDFGRDAFAGLRLTIDGGEGGEEAFIHLGEALGADGGVDRKPPGSVRYHHTAIILTAGKHPYDVSLTPKDARRMPPEIGPVMPFRYVEIEAGAARAISLSQQIVAHYPFDEQAARFTSSDPRLNDVWNLCAYSMKATSFCGVFVDGDRERLPYEADAYINQLGWYSCSGDYALPRYTGEHLLTNTTWPTEWFLHSVLIAWADYLYTGDNDSLQLCYNDLKGKTLTDLEGTDGLIRTVDPAPSTASLAAAHAQRMQDIVDWPVAERDGYQMRPVNTVVNCFHYRALTEMARIADATGHPADAADYRSRATRVAAAINAKLFDPATGLYLDGDGTTHSALHANLFPLAFGLVPADRVPKVVAFLKSKGMACSVYAAQYLLEALYASGEGDYALNLMLAPGDRSWDYMAHGSGATITTEAWAQHYKPNQDWTHAWGAAPANILPRCLMGVEPLEPGFRTLRIRPQIGTLTQAALDLPTIRGTVHVEVQHPVGGHFTVNTRIPANTRADVWLPRGGKAGATVTMDGKPRAGRVDGDWVVVTGVGSGGHVLVR